MKKVILFLVLLSSFVLAQVNRGGVVYTSAGNEAVGNLTSSYGYLMTSFRTADMGLYLFASKDGKSWTKLTAGNSYNGSSSKSTVVRDPSVIYTRDKYWVVHTSNSFAIDSGFSVISSEDLITWDTVAFVDVSSVCTPYSKVYAPDFYLDPVTDSVFVYVTISDSLDTDFKIYELNPTNDAMTTWSSPTLVNGNFPPSTIDANMNRIGDTFYLFYTKNHTDSRIEYATSSTRNGVYVVQDSLSQLGWSEGSCLVDLGNGSYRLYYDNFPTGDHKIYYTESSDTFATWSTPQIIETPYEDIQHGTIVKTNNTKIITDAIFPNYKKEKNILTFPYEKLVYNVDSTEQVFKFYITRNGSDNNDGQSWAKGRKTISGLFNVLPSDLMGYQVYVFVEGGDHNEEINLNFSNGSLYIFGVFSDHNVTGDSFNQWMNGGESVNFTSDSLRFTSDASIMKAYGSNAIIKFSAINPTDLNKAYFGRMIFESTSTSVAFPLYDSYPTLEIIFVGPKFNLGTCNGQYIVCVGRKLKLDSPLFVGGTGTATSQTGNWRGALNFTGTDNASIIIGDIGQGISYDASYSPTVSGGIEFIDIAQGLNIMNGSTSSNLNMNTSSVLYSDVNKAYGKTIFRISSAMVGANIVYNSDYCTLSDASTGSKTLTDLKTGIVSINLSKNIIDNSSNVFINNLPTTAPTTSGALWRDASAGNVIKVVP